MKQSAEIPKLRLLDSSGFVTYICLISDVMIDFFFLVSHPASIYLSRELENC